MADPIEKRLRMAFGPIDLIVLEFKGKTFGDEIIASVADLVAGEIIRILDLVVVHKDAHGNVVVQELKGTPPSDLQLLEPQGRDQWDDHG